MEPPTRQKKATTPSPILFEVWFSAACCIQGPLSGITEVDRFRPSIGWFVRSRAIYPTVVLIDTYALLRPCCGYKLCSAFVIDAYKESSARLSVPRDDTKQFRVYGLTHAITDDVVFQAMFNVHDETWWRSG